MLQRHQPRRQLARDLLARFCPGSQVPEPFSQLIFHPHLHLAHRWAAGQQGTSGKRLIRGYRSPKGQAGQEQRLYPEFNSVSAPAVGLGQLPQGKRTCPIQKTGPRFFCRGPTGHKKSGSQRGSFTGPGPAAGSRLAHSPISSCEPLLFTEDPVPLLFLPGQEAI